MGIAMESNQFFIGYTLPGSDTQSAVPVAFGDMVRNGFNGWALCDGAYDAFDYWYCDSDFSDCDMRDDAPYALFEDALCSVIAPKLATMAYGDSVSYMVNGISFTFQKCED